MPTLQEDRIGEVAETVEMVAHRLASEAAADPLILRTYWFPAENEVRLVYVDASAPPSQTVMPFYFGTSKEQGIPYPSAAAVIRPEEEPGQPGEITPPLHWGTWADARIGQTRP